MLKKHKNIAFSLAEVLITMVVIGAVAILVLPSLISNVSNKTYASQIRNFASQVQQVAADQLVIHKTNTLYSTDFATAGDLVNNRNFVTTKTCVDSSIASCWSSPTFRTINGTNADVTSLRTGTGVSAILKNGVVFRYFPVNYNNKTVGYFTVDVNGKDDPNIFGKDLYGFFVTPNGQIAFPSEAGVGTGINNCKQANVVYAEAMCYEILETGDLASHY